MKLKKNKTEGKLKYKNNNAKNDSREEIQNRNLVKRRMHYKKKQLYHLKQ